MGEWLPLEEIEIGMITRSSSFFLPLFLHFFSLQKNLVKSIHEHDFESWSNIKRGSLLSLSFFSSFFLSLFLSSLTIEKWDHGKKIKITVIMKWISLPYNFLPLREGEEGRKKRERERKERERERKEREVVLFWSNLFWTFISSSFESALIWIFSDMNERAMKWKKKERKREEERRKNGMSADLFIIRDTWSGTNFSLPKIFYPSLLSLPSLSCSGFPPKRMKRKKEKEERKRKEEEKISVINTRNLWFR